MVFPTLVGRKAVGTLLLASTASLLASGDSSEAAKQCARLARTPGKPGSLALNDGSLAQAHYQKTSAVCAAAFEDQRDSSAGLSAAKADFHLRRDDAVLTWPNRLTGTRHEAASWEVVAWVHQRRKDARQERAARVRVLELHLASKNHGEAARAAYHLFYFGWTRAESPRDQLEFLRVTYEEAAKVPNRDLQAMAAEALITPLLQIGDLGSARHVLRTATELRSTKPATAELANLEGIIRLREGQYSMAVASFTRALELAGPKADPRLPRSIYLNLVEVSLKDGKLADAEAYLKSAWSHAGTAKPAPTSLFHFGAAVALAQGRYREAKDAALTGLSEEVTPEWKWQLESALGSANEGLGQLAAAEAAFAQAAAGVEKLRQGVDFDDLKSWLLDRRREPYEGLFRLHARAGRAQAAIEVLERAKARTFLDAFIRSASTPTAEARGEGFLAESTARVDGLHALLPIMSKSPAVEVRPIESVLDGVRDKNVLVYFEAGDELWLVSLLTGRTRLYRIPQTRRAVRELVERFLAERDDAAVATALGNALLPPGSLPPVGSALHIVTDGTLGRMPFAALLPRGRALVRDYTLSYVPSLNALHAAGERASVAYGPAVVLGDSRSDLPAAGRESADVAALLGVTPYVGRAATRARIAEAARAGVLHLATHTGVGTRGPWIAMTDGDVDAATLLTQSTQPRLAVLATCASAAKEGRDLWGSLGAAFLAAGTKAVLASLWSIRDDEAREFVMRFYQEGGAANSAEALARTQRAFIDQGKPARFWAPFVHFGTAVAERNP
jgi:tetratricopeptide (TPR) repeat protein